MGTSAEEYSLQFDIQTENQLLPRNASVSQRGDICSQSLLEVNKRLARLVCLVQT